MPELTLSIKHVYYFQIEIDHQLKLSELLQKLIDIANTGEDPEGICRNDLHVRNFVITHFKGWVPEQHQLSFHVRTLNSEPFPYENTIEQWLQAHTDNSTTVPNALFYRGPCLELSYPSNDAQDFIKNFLKRISKNTLRISIPSQIITPFSEQELENIAEEIAEEALSINPKFEGCVLQESYCPNFPPDPKSIKFQEELRKRLFFCAKKRQEIHSQLTQVSHLADVVADLTMGYLTGIDESLITSNADDALRDNELLAIIVDKIKEHIMKGTGRFTSAQSGEKIHLLTLCSEQIRNSKEPIKLYLMLPFIEQIVAIKRHQYSFWQPHSVKEFKILAQKAFPDYYEDNQAKKVVYSKEEVKGVWDIESLSDLLSQKEANFSTVPAQK